MHIFPPIDLKHTKLQNKNGENFGLRRATLHSNKFHLGTKYTSKREGGMNIKFNIHPCKAQSQMVDR